MELTPEKKSLFDKRYEIRPNPTGLRYGIIEVTTKCQLACPGCYMVRRKTLNFDQMTLSQAIRILDLCRDYSGRELETMDILGGEPLLWPFLKAYIEELLCRGITPWIFTNMLAIRQDLASWLYNRGVYITGKLNINPYQSAQLGLQAQMIGRSSKMAQMMIEKIKVFQQAGYGNPMFRLQNLVRKDNLDHVPDYYRWCLSNNIGTDLEMMGSGEVIDENYWQVAAEPKQIAEMIKKIQQVRREFNLEPAKVLMPHIFGACPFYDKGLYFAVDGSIRACSNSTVVLSNTKEEEPIKKAYESTLICNRLRLSKETVKGPCGSCYKWDECRGGCRATAEGTGDSFASYPLCPVPYLEN